MYSKAPQFSKTILIGDNPELLARLSARYSKKGTYLPVIEGPRLLRPDGTAEVIRCNNAAARTSPEKIILAGLPESTCKLFAKRLPVKKTLQISNFEEIENSEEREVILWGHDNIGIGLLKALREKKDIFFLDGGKTDESVERVSNHIIICENNEPLAQVIAANYAFALAADLRIMESISDEEQETIQNEFYNLYENFSTYPTKALEDLKTKLRSFHPSLNFKNGELVTFIIKGVAWGFAYPEIPTTHLFKYPNLGISIVNAIAAEQSSSGSNIATIIDPSLTISDDTDIAIKYFTKSGMFSKVLQSSGASVYQAQKAIEWYPYDILLISTHCGDAEGWRWTYEFKDSEGKDRTLVVDLAISINGVLIDEKIEVLKFIRFVSLDGVDWNDREKKINLYVGKAINDFFEKQKDKDFLPNKKEMISRVLWSSALKMHNGNYIATPVQLAGNSTPIIINNACGSWHRLAGDFTFAGARVYIGTLFPINGMEAGPFIQKLINRYADKPLTLALWRAMNDIYPNQVRRPYIMVGCHFQRVRASRANAPSLIMRSLQSSYLYCFTSKSGKLDNQEWYTRKMMDNCKYLQGEMQRIRDKWFPKRLRNKP